MRKSQSKPKWQKETATERISRLLELAGREAAIRPERSRRYAQLASRIAMRYNIRIPPVQKRKICGGCGMFLVPGVSCTVRISAGRKVVTCLSCKTARRFVVGRRVAL